MTDEPWGLLSFEYSEASDPNEDPPVVKEARALYRASQPRDFCVAVRWRVEGEKRFRDYWFSPNAVRACGQQLVKLVGTKMVFHPKPDEDDFESAVGNDCLPLLRN
jgi:hypothetical protein